MLSPVTQSIRHRLFTADWIEVLFMHFRIAPDVLQPEIPLPLETREGWAYVSLVAFTQRRLRPVYGGRLAARLAGPMAEHEFLNVRTYVRPPGTQAGKSIYFMAEWIPNRLAAFIGPRTYGLPYRLARLEYRSDRSGRVSSGGRAVAFRALPGPMSRPSAAEPRSLTHFLIERYTAYTCRGGIVRRFDVAHRPWMQSPVEVELLETSLLPTSGKWFDRAELVSAEYSAGVRDVVISRPRRCR